MADGRTVISSVPERSRIPVRFALVAVLVSALLRAPWFVLVLIMPRTATGGVLFYLVVASAGVVLLHWSLSWFEWTISLRAALVARALPGLAAATLAGLFGFHASVRAVLGLAVFEFLLGVFVVGVSATRPVGWGAFGTGFEDGELLSLSVDGVEGEEDTDPEHRYGRHIAGLVRDARALRLG
jgi:hypothetical protein